MPQSFDRITGSSRIERNPGHPVIPSISVLGIASHLRPVAFPAGRRRISCRHPSPTGGFAAMTRALPALLLIAAVGVADAQAPKDPPKKAQTGPAVEETPY